MKAKYLRMNTRKKDKRIDVSGQCSNEVVTHARFLPLVKLAPVLQIAFRLGE